MPSPIDPALRQRTRAEARAQRFSTREPIEAKFDGRCPACGEAITEGDPIVGIFDKFKHKSTYVHAGECVEEWIG